jgi:fatty acid desaturase
MAPRSGASSAVPSRPGTVVPADDVLPRVLPTDRLGPTGMARAEARAGLRRIPDARNALTVAGVWAQLAATVVVATRWPHPLVLVTAVLVAGTLHARFAILMHEAAHRLLFSNRRVNDTAGTWLVAYPAFVPIAVYRRGHMAHHRDAFGPDEPDLALYAGYPLPAASLRRKLRRDALGISGWKNLRPLFGALGSRTARPTAASILAVQGVAWAGSWLATGAWWAWPLVWFLPWMTVWRVLNRLRSIAEHGGLIHSDDTRLSTHVVRQHLVARAVLVPFHTGWHLAHHVDPGIPWRNLPRFHDELERAGYVTDALTWPGYPSLWRALASGKMAG